MKFSHALMENNITQDDRLIASKFILKESMLTNSKKVREFEKKWSSWLGVKYSVFVNSGSSANLISMHVLKLLNETKNKNEVLVPSLTWSSDIISTLNAGFKPVFIDINLSNLSMSLKEIKKKVTNKTLAIFLTHAQGFNGISDELLSFLKKKQIILIEDVCESHGAMFKKQKLGSIGKISNFSFYYAHHMSTIEGGMVCTNDKKIYEISRVLRSHGMAREIDDKTIKKKITKENPELNSKFIFLYPGFNMRNNEISAVIGLNQLKRLDKNILGRNKNFKIFLSELRGDIFYKNFDMNGISNYAFPLILKNKNLKIREKLEKIMKKNNIEFRRGNAGGGNQLRQPYLRNFAKLQKPLNFVNTEHIHFYGYYIGNYPDLKKEKIVKLCKILNSVQIK